MTTRTVYFEATFKDVGCTIQVPEGVIVKGEEAIRSYIAKNEKEIESDSLWSTDEWKYLLQHRIETFTIKNIENEPDGLL